ncbi:MAG TPA: VOC family protein [Burkholderiaceae bacterium]|nr:VOC family protein [Burkholderiaceae bacterium]
MTGTDSLFGRVRLGYVLVESRRRDAWQRFATEGLGLHAEPVASGALALRVDERERRLIIRPGPAEDVVALGWEFDDAAALEAALARLRGVGVGLAPIGGADAELRGIRAGWQCRGPKDTPLELFTAADAKAATAPLCMRVSAFVTGALGLGHLAITTREPQAMERFWVRLFDARVSDRIEDRLSGMAMDFTFLRLNRRHHTVAIASTRRPRLDPLRTRIHHLNLQTATLDDVVQGYRQCRALGYPIASAIGQHPNDKELSFYVQTPSDFEIELGCNPITIEAADEQNWRTGAYRGISLWGHHPENLTLALQARRVGRGLLSLARREARAGIDDAIEPRNRS